MTLRKPCFTQMFLAFVLYTVLHAGYAAADYNPYALEQVTSGFSAEPEIALSSQHPATITGRANDSTVHGIFYGAQGMAPPAIFYTHNVYGPGQQGWLPPEQVSEQEIPEFYSEGLIGGTVVQDYVPTDAAGNPHMVWNSHALSEPDITTLDEFQMPISEAWYRSRDMVTEIWSPETKLTDYASDVTLIDTDAASCLGEAPPAGRHWWRRWRPHHPIMGVEADGTPRFAWSKQSLTLPFHPVTGERCSSPGGSPQPDEQHLVSREGVTGPEEELVAAFIGVALPVNMTIDHADTAHLFIRDVPELGIIGGPRAVLWYASAGRDESWTAPIAITPDFSADQTYFVDATVDHENVVHALVYALFPETTYYYQIVDRVWQSPKIVPGGGEIAINREGQPFIGGSAGLLTRYKGEWITI